MKNYIFQKREELLEGGSWMNNHIEPTDIAIIGMSGRFPGAKNINEFWINLLQGKEMLQEFEDKELEANGVSASLLNHPEYQKVGAVVDDIDMFDANFFGFTPFEAKITDPQHRLFLECVWEALEDSGYVPAKFDGRIGVFGSTSMSSYLINNIMSSSDFSNEGINYPVLIGNDKDFLSTRVSYKLNLTGPSVTIQTACSSSLVAIHQACQSILTGESDIAIAGGVSLSVPQNVGYLYKEGGILSRDGHCRPFDQQANGTIKGNGCGVIVLKSLEQAVKDKDHIYSIIKSTTINNDGANKMGFTAPSVSGQAKVIEEALYLANLEGKDIGYIEAHGTGTPLGDPIEIQALTKAYGQVDGGKCAIGSLKANIGHLDAAAGVAGVIKTALILKYQAIPPTPNFNQANKHLNLDKTPFYIAAKLENKNIDYAGVSSFGIGGTNAHIILQKPMITNLNQDQQLEESNLFVLSAKNSFSLNQMRKNLKMSLENNEYNLGDVAYTLAHGREEFDYRFIAIADNKEELIEQLDREEFNISSKDNINLAFELGYNGSLLSSLSKQNFVFKKTIESLMKKIVELNSAITAESLFNTDNYYTLKHFVYNYTLGHFLEESGLKPKLFISHNKVEDLAVLALTKQITLELALKTILNIPVTDTTTYEKETSEGPLLLLSDGKFHNGATKRVLDYVTDKVNMENQQHHLQVPEIYELICFSEITVNKNNRDSCDNDYKPFLYLIGMLWAKGAKINWNFFICGKKRVPLPTYAFCKERYWIEPDKKEKSTEHLTEEEDDIVKVVLGAWKRYLEVDNITLDDNYYELGGDSLAAVEIVSEIRDKLNISISLNDFMDMETPRDIVTYVQKHRISIQETPSFVKKIKEGSGEANLFLVHPAGGNNICYNNLIRHIHHSEKNIYVISYPDNQYVDENMKQIAAYYISAIKKVQPNGHYNLGGYSFGGNLAFEMALQLQNEGKTVNEIVMFDSHPPEAYYGKSITDEYFVQAFPLVVDMFLKGQDINMNQLQENKGLSLENVIQKIVLSNNLNVGESEYRKLFKIWKNNHNALKAYYPTQKFKGDIVFFEAEEVESQEVLELLKIKRVDKKIWQHHIEGELKIYKVPGNHYSMFGNQVKEVARSFDKFYLNKKERKTKCET